MLKEKQGNSFSRLLNLLKKLSFSPNTIDGLRITVLNDVDDMLDIYLSALPFDCKYLLNPLSSALSALS
jgi:hypothetical protein